MQIVRKIMPYVIAGAGVLGAAGICANQKANVQEMEQTKKSEALYQHKLDSVMKADKTDALQASFRVNSEALENCNKLLAQIPYKTECAKRGLDSRLPQTKEDLEAIQKQEQKIDSIKNEIEVIKTKNLFNSSDSTAREANNLLKEVGLKFIKK